MRIVLSLSDVKNWVNELGTTIEAFVLISRFFAMVTISTLIFAVPHQDFLKAVDWFFCSPMQETMTKEFRISKAVIFTNPDY